MHALELRVPPLALVLVSGLVMWAVAANLPRAIFSLPGAPVFAIAIALTGLAIAFAGVSAFRRHSTTVNPMSPDAAASIVSDGIYRFTRNPMYLGLVLMLTGWALYLANLAALIILPAFAAYMTQFQIKPEERALLAKFEPGYAEYMASVRRWI